MPDLTHTFWSMECEENKRKELEYLLEEGTRVFLLGP